MPTPEKSELILPDGQVFYSGGGGASGSRMTGVSNTAFDVIPYTAEKLKFAASFQGQRFDWEIPNPTYDPARGATGTPEPLPQTREAGDFQVTLREVKLESVTYPPTNWRAEPVFSISSQGKDVANWFSPSHRISEGGLLSAPAWRITAGLSRTNQYPFKADEVQWIGTLAGREADALEAEKHKMFPLNEEVMARGIKFAGIFGPGEYDIREGMVIKTAPRSDAKKERVATTDWDHKTNTFHMTLKDSAFVVLDRFRRGIQVFRNSADQPVRLKEVWSHGSGAGRLAIHSLPADAVRFGVADRNEPSLAGQSLEFVVRPPAIPLQKDTAEKH